MATTPTWINDGSEIPDPFGFGEEAVQWLRKLKHPKNPAPGHPFELSEWQERIIRKIFGPCYTEDNPELGQKKGHRIARRVCLLLPRGNRKTSLCAAISLLMLRGPARLPGTLLLSAASTADQSRELFREAALIVQHDSRLDKHMQVKTGVGSISYPKSSTLYRAVSANGPGMHGKTPYLVICDELHAWEGNAGRELWKSLDSARVKVPNSLFIVATTAGRGQENLAWEFVSRAIKVQNGEIDDPGLLPIVFAADKDDDWKDPDLWRLVNPGLSEGMVDLATFVEKAKLSETSPFDRASFLQFNLNVWQDRSTSPFVDMSVYDEGREPIGDELLDRLKSLPCFVGVDLSVSNDLTAIVAAWRDPDDEKGFIVKPWFFCPADELAGRADRDGVPYRQWAKDGLIEPTPGPVVDQDRIGGFLHELCSEFAVAEIAYDPARASLLMTKLAGEGLPVLRFDQSWRMMAPAADTLQRAIIGRNFRHGGNPILRWHFDNIAVVRDRNDNIAFHKSKSTDRIDGAIAAAMAVARAAANDTTPSIYSDPDCDPASWFEAA
ncbi:terminase TerL endonuclease subunit [Fulvimarina sp. 2208YS6-2-32]|uniref:Terminase TerL endonuclease subunit n=1 Tax=Fulvimarina uroteuthidis TaxID=3098149 RepID=A0ABU5HYU9_9HYPH|nr:terminase TerL endonuclease subunit [Fulvimarina sp. 2208YS6-2-32]MDY8107769.1 terminase TerL endonuclease subunit [Fulvimarina sp. 2208YS6-2-32]